MCVAGVIHSLRVSKRLSIQVAALIALTSASLAEACASKAQLKKEPANLPVFFMPIIFIAPIRRGHLNRRYRRPVLASSYLKG